MIVKVNPAGWGLGEKLTSAQMNAVDATLITAVDKTSAGDTIEGPITLADAGRLLISPSVGPDANTTFVVGDGDNIVYVTTAVTADRAYTLSTAGAANGDTLQFYCDPAFVHTITLQVAGPTTLFTLGNGARADGRTATFVYSSTAGWHLKDQSQGSRHYQETFTAPGSWVCPRGVTTALLVGWGGGGAGANGDNGNGTTGYARGGGGGAGALQVVAQVAVTPSTTYAVTVGAGGVVGAFDPGGGSTIFGALATFTGGRPGCRYSAYDANRLASRGGSHTQDMGLQLFTTADAPSLAASAGGHGGIGRPGAVASQVGGSNGRYLGGEGGVAASDSGSYKGGGAGGGGGAGPGGNGGDGGFGGDGDAGTGDTGVAGSSPAANSGAGGGGGGAGGGGGINGAGAAGGNGGSGQLTVIWVK